jgi:PAS domain S-box-containing protein
MADLDHSEKIALLDQCISIQQHLFGADSLENLLELTESLFEEILPLQYTGLYLYNEVEQKLELKVAHGFSEKERRVAENTAMERHPGKVFFSGSPIYVPDTEYDTSNITTDSTRSFAVRCRLYQPITVQGKNIGVFGVVSGTPNAFSDLDRKIFEFVCRVFGKAYLTLIQVNEIQKTNEQLNLLSFLATHTDNAVIVTDEHGKTQWVNDAFTRISGYTLQEMSGKKPGKILQGSSSDLNVSKNISEAIRNQKEIHTNILNYTKTGEEYINELSIYPFRKNGKDITNFIALQRNITQRVNDTLKIEQQGRQLQAIFQSLPDIIFILNTFGRIEEVFVNEEHPRRAYLLTLKGQAIHELVLQEHLAEVFIVSLQKTIHEKTLQTLEIGDDWFETDKVFEARLAPLDDQRALCLLRNITEEFNIRKERERIQRFNQILSELSIQLLFSEVSQFEAVIESMLREIGNYFEVDRAYLFEFSDNGEHINNTYEWCRPGIGSVKQELQKVPVSFSQWWISKLLRNEPVYISNTESMPERLSAERQMLVSQQVKSLLNLPLKVNGNVVGFFGCDAVLTRKLWSELEISQMQLAGEILANTFSRRQWIIERDRFRTVFEHSVFGALILNEQNDVVYQNQFLRNLLASKGNEAANHAVKHLLSTALIDEQPLTYELLCQWPSRSAFELKLAGNNGDTQTLLCNSVVLPVEPSKPALVALTFIDISERIQQEQEVQQALHIVSEQNKRLLNFSYIVSHNIRSHASTISGFIQLLHDEEDQDERKQLIKGLTKSSKSLDDTLRHLSELLNIQSRVGILKRNIGMREAVERALSVIAVDLGTIPHTLSLDIPDSFCVHTDSSYLDSILLNLLTNAVKYRQCDVPLSIQVKAWHCSGGLCFSVADNGRGIDLERYGDKLFGMFKTFHGNTDARGIGLFITRNQIEALGGRIEVESKPNFGSCFTVYLP